MKYSIIPRLLSAFAIFLCITCLARAQELAAQPTPFTALLDFPVWRHPEIPKPALPIWLESVQYIPAEPAAVSSDDTSMGLPEEKPAPHTTFRIRLRNIQGLNDQLLLRLYFDDRASAHPTVTAWTETGECKFSSGPLGAGLELPVSESIAIPAQGANYLEIDVPGDGSNLRKAFLSPLKKTTANVALDFAENPEPAVPVVDPFEGSPAKPVTDTDTYLFGRVRALLAADVIKLDPQNRSVSFEFNLESVPLLSFVAVEVLNADPLAPLQAWANRQPLGPVVPRYPDLADPAYNGIVGPLEPMRFRYAGWLQAQVIIPGSALKVGVNTLTIQLPGETGPAAIRAVELQLKHNWRSLDYTLKP